jgi:hypothetical protein
MPDPERELSPEQEADVRRLLAEARATEPLPPDVASRLDRVLGDLGAERPVPAEPAGETVAPAVRRRRASMLLAAAAAVVAVGVALGQVDRFAGNDDSGSTGAQGASSAERTPSAEVSGNAAGRSAAEDSTGGSAAEDSPGGSAAEDSSGRRVPASMARTPPPGAATPVGRIREARFSADANQLRRALPPGAAAGGGFVELATGQLPAGYVLTGRAYDCAPARWGAGALVPVVFEGTPAVLAYRPVIGDSQVVELLQCGTGETLRSTTLQAG